MGVSIIGKLKIGGEGHRREGLKRERKGDEEGKDKQREVIYKRGVTSKGEP